MAEGATDDATLDAYAAAQARLEHAGGYNWREARQRDAARPRLPRRAPRPRAGDVLRRRADARVARPRAGRRPRPAAARRADQPPRHRVARVARERTCRRSTRRSCSSPTTAGSSRRSAPSVLELEAGRARFFKGTWHAWRKEKAARELALGRAIEKQQAEIERLERFVDPLPRRHPRAPGAVAREEARQDRPHRRATRATARRSASPSSRRSAPAAWSSRSRTASCRSATARCCEDAELWLERGEHVSLVGPNGTGKTTLITRARRRARARRAASCAAATTSSSGCSPSTPRSSGASAGTVLEAAQRATGLKPNEARALLGQLPVQRRGGREAARRACPAASAGGCRWRSSSTRAPTC